MEDTLSPVAFRTQERLIYCVTSRCTCLFLNRCFIWDYLPADGSIVSLPEVPYPVRCHPYRLRHTAERYLQTRLAECRIWTPLLPVRHSWERTPQAGPQTPSGHLQEVKNVALTPAIEESFDHLPSFMPKYGNFENWAISRKPQPVAQK